jgi:hypothetical protein
MKVDINVTEIHEQYTIEFSKDGATVRRSFFDDEKTLALISAKACVNMLESLGIEYTYSSELSENKS